MVTSAALGRRQRRVAPLDLSAEPQHSLPPGHSSPSPRLSPAGPGESPDGLQRRVCEAGCHPVSSTTS